MYKEYKKEKEEFKVYLQNKKRFIKQRSILAIKFLVI